MKRLSILVAVGVIALAPAFAQSGGGDTGGGGTTGGGTTSGGGGTIGGTGGSGGGATTATCTTAPTNLVAMNIERTLNLATSNTTLTPNIPASVASAISSGALEAREQLTFDSAANTVLVQQFTAQPGSPSPTPASGINGSSILTRATVKIDKTYFSCSPVPSMLIVGTISSNVPPSPFGTLSGTPVAISLGYTTDDPPNVNSVVVVLAGTVSEYTPSAVGTLQFPGSSVTPPGSSGNGPVIVIANGNTQTTTSRQMVLDASGSTDPNHLQLTYVWTQPTPGSGCPADTAAGQACSLAASISGSNTAMPLVTFGQGRGDYLFNVTATNSAGVSSTQLVRITYIGQ